MRPWRQDLFIQAAGSAIGGAILALGAVLFGLIGSTSLQTWTRVGTFVLVLGFWFAWSLSSSYVFGLIYRRIFGVTFTEYIKRKLDRLLDVGDGPPDGSPDGRSDDGRDDERLL